MPWFDLVCEKFDRLITFLLQESHNPTRTVIWRVLLDFLAERGARTHDNGIETLHLTISLVSTGFNVASYHLITTKQSMEESKQMCVDMGMNLAVITSAAEQEFINDIIT